jgi:uncharacterized protein
MLAWGLPGGSGLFLWTLAGSAASIPTTTYHGVLQMTMYPDRARPVELDYGTDSGVLVRFFNTVYAWMAVGLAVTAVVAFLVSKSTAGLGLIYANKGVYAIIALVAFGLAWFVQSQAGKLSAGVSTALFLVYASIVGALISGIFIIYSPQVLISALALTCGTFGAMSIYGFVTKRDLTGIGSFMVMCAFGLIIASFVNLWLGSNLLSWIITYGILGAFIVITAYETQALKNVAYETRGNPDLAARFAIVGALVLYISFINIFLSILRILGDRE